jgi:hypothetical protein
MVEILTALYITCMQLTVPNPHTIHNLPEEQCVVIYSYAMDKCYMGMQGMAQMCEAQGEPLCSQESFDKIIDLNTVCRGDDDDYVQEGFPVRGVDI